MIGKIAQLEKTLQSLGFNQYSSIVKIAINLIDKTDGSLTLNKIIDVEERGFGMAFSSSDSSLKQQITDVMESKNIDQYIFANKELLLEYIPENFRSIIDLEALNELYDKSNEKERKKKSFFQNVKNKIFSGPLRMAYNAAREKVKNYILNMSTKSFSEFDSKLVNAVLKEITDGDYEKDDEIVIFGSESAYIIMGVGYDREEEAWEADIFDMTSDKASLGYKMSSIKNVFTEAIKYCINHEHNIGVIRFTARKSTSDALMKKIFYSTVEELKRVSKYVEENPEKDIEWKKRYSELYRRHYPDGGGMDGDIHYNEAKVERFFQDDTHKRIREVFRDPVPEHHLETGLRTNEEEVLDEKTNKIEIAEQTEQELKENIKLLVNDLTGYYNYISRYLKKSYTDSANVDMDTIERTMSLFNFSKTKPNKRGYNNCDVHKIENICIILNDIESEVVKKQKGFFGKTFVNFEKICEDYLLKLKTSIYDHLKENKKEYYVNEPYYGYEIYLKND